MIPILIHIPYAYMDWKFKKGGIVVGERMVAKWVNMIMKSTVWITSYTAVCKNKLVNIFKFLLSEDSINFYTAVLILCGENHVTVSTLF